MQTQLTDMSATSIIALFQTNKEQRAAFARQVVSAVIEGEANPLNVHLQIKAMEDIIATIKESIDYKDAVLEYANPYGKSFEYMNAKIEIREVGTKYNYDQCNDTHLITLKSNESDIKKKLKAREEFLRCAPSEGTLITDEETGETIKVYPPSKSSTTSVVITLK